MPQLLPLGMRDPLEGAVVDLGDQSVAYGTTWVLHLGQRCSCNKPYPHLGVAGGRVQKVSGVDSLVQWIRVTLTVERFRYPIYSDDYGVEFDELVARSPTAEEVETEAPRMVREALEIDSRVEEVRLVQVAPTPEDPSSYFVDMEVITFSGDLASISVIEQLEG